MGACRRCWAGAVPFKASLVFLCTAFLFSCGGKRPALFPVRGTNAALAAFSREAAAGTLDFARPKKLKYRFEPVPVFPFPASLEIVYGFSVPPSGEMKDSLQLVLEIGGGDQTGAVWALPMDLVFLDIDAGSALIHYAIPVAESFAGEFSIALAPLEPGPEKNPRRADRDALPRFQIHSLEITGRWFGYYPGNANTAEEGHFFTTPFVFARREDGRREFVIDLPPLFGAAREAGLLPALSVELAPGREALASAGNRRFTVSSFSEGLRLPPGTFAPDSGPVLVSGDRIRSFQITYAAPPPFPAPVTADPGLVLAWPLEQWRNPRYELFRLEQFPTLLIFDTASYAVQDRLFKRLAFFTEKAGFRGRLAPDGEIAGLHGWNAHDYRAEDLARFFEAARLSDFPLLSEERELERILLDNGIIRRAAGGGLAAGEGGIISISRESADYLRSLFMVHEAFHGIFFIDEDFRAFSRRRWEQLGADAKRFIISYFDYQHYDIKDAYLLVNEFMAHVLQQPVSQAGRYFGQTLPARLETSSWRKTALPPKNPASSSWPLLAGAFSAEAEAFSAYVNRRWGLAAGRVRQLTALQEY
jgi:hypothetical protein